MSPCLHMTGVSVRRGTRQVLTDVSLSVQPGEIVGIVGPNGAGKTTLLQAALGLLPLAGGTCELAGRPISQIKFRQMATLVGYMPQDRRVGWNLSATKVAALGAARLPPGAADVRAVQALGRVGLGDQAGRGVLDLSGGERARVLLARLLVTKAPLLVADEPVSGLDPLAQLLALELLAQEARGGAGVLLTLHDLSLASQACHRLIVLDQGRLVADARPMQALSPPILASVFGLAGELVETPNGPLLSARMAAQGLGIGAIVAVPGEGAPPAGPASV